MFRKPRQPRPQDCPLQRINFESARRTRYVNKSVPNRESDEYSAALKLNDGKFNSYYYHGDWHEVTETHEIPVQIGHFTCRRVEKEQLDEVALQMDVDGNVRPDLAREIYKTVGRLGYCATCAYVGMTGVEADQHDAQVMHAQADQLEAKLHLEQARRDLEEYLQQNGHNPTIT